MSFPHTRREYELPTRWPFRLIGVGAELACGSGSVRLRLSGPTEQIEKLEREHGLVRLRDLITVKD